MRPLRVLLVLLLIGGGIGASLVLVSKGDAIAARLPALSDLAVDDDGDRPDDRERSRPPQASGAGHATPPGVGRRRRTPPPAGPPPSQVSRPAPAFRRRPFTGALAVLVAGLEIAAGLLLLGLLLVVLALRRLRRRSRREYALYELHLSTHDQAKGQDLEDMVESIANIVRAWPADRCATGSPTWRWS